MLSIKAIGNSAEEVNYYANLGSFESDTFEYYSEANLRPGIWWGGGASALGLEGVVSPEVFANVLEGRTPEGTRSLVQQQRSKNRKRRSGFDLTFSVPKSLSCLWSQLPREDREKIDKLVEDSVHRTLEAFVSLCGQSRRGKGGNTIEDAAPVIALFRHDTARPIPGGIADPNLHVHAVVANLCFRESDGTFGAWDARKLFGKRMKMALGAMFRAELSSKLQEHLGLKTYRPLRGRKKKVASWWEISGVPAAFVEAMSKRRKEIERWLKKHGLSGAIASEKAALNTREGKSKHSMEELYAEWNRLGQKHDFGPQQAIDLLSAQVDLSKRQDPSEIAALAVAELSEMKARLTENEILELTAVEAQGRGLGVAEIVSSVKRLIESSKELVRLNDKSGVRAFTTKTMLEIEKQMLKRADRLSKLTSHPVNKSAVERAIAEAETVRPQQAMCIREIALGADLVSVVGVAGSGKTFALGVARNALERSGYSVIGTALASKAAKGLENGSGIKSIHLHSLLHQIESGRIAIGPKTILVCDEAGMVGTVMLGKLLRIADRSGAKVALIGDHRQLQAIDSGAPFRMIAEEMGAAELTEIVRQRESWQRETVKDFRDGLAERALVELHRRGRLKIEEHRDLALEAVVNDWESLIDSGQGSLRNTVVFAGTNGEVADLNELIQYRYRLRGGLGSHSVHVDGVSFYPGDRVIVTKNKPLYGLRNGTLADVVGAWDSSLLLRTEDGFEVEVDTEEFKELDLAYAMNGHRGQGVTVENALVLVGDSMTDREMSYVLASRAKGMTILYSDEESVADIPELAERMSQSNQNEMAVEHLRQEMAC